MLWLKTYMNENHEKPLRNLNKPKKVKQPKPQDKVETAEKAQITEKKPNFTIGDYEIEMSHSDSGSSDSDDEERSSCSEFVLKPENEEGQMEVDSN